MFHLFSCFFFPCASITRSLNFHGFFPYFIVVFLLSSKTVLVEVRDDFGYETIEVGYVKTGYWIDSVFGGGIKNISTVEVVSYPLYNRFIISSEIYGEHGTVVYPVAESSIFDDYKRALSIDDTTDISTIFIIVVAFWEEDFSRSFQNGHGFKFFPHCFHSSIWEESTYLFWEKTWKDVFHILNFFFRPRRVELIISRFHVIYPTAESLAIQHVFRFSDDRAVSCTPQVEGTLTSFTFALEQTKKLCKAQEQISPALSKHLARQLEQQE